MEVEEQQGGRGGVWRWRSSREVAVMLDEGQKIHGNKHIYHGKHLPIFYKPFSFSA